MRGRSALRRRFEEAEKAYNGMRELIERDDMQAARAFARENKAVLSDYTRLKGEKTCSTKLRVRGEIWTIRVDI